MSKELIIIPDVHGRTFWKDAVKGNEDKPIIFLGDYVDCYPDEGITPEETYTNFEEIIDFAKSHPNVVLLLGNHDLGYIDRDICTCRHDWQRASDIANLFTSNKDLFKLYHNATVGKMGWEYDFSHAGIHKAWLDKHGIWFNDLNDNIFENKKLLNALADVSYCRGGFSSFGSMVWADIREFLREEEEDEYDIPNNRQIVGHTRCGKAFFVEPTMTYMLDAQCAFYIDEDNKVRYFNDDKEVETLKS